MPFFENAIHLDTYLISDYPEAVSLAGNLFEGVIGKDTYSWFFHCSCRLGKRVIWGYDRGIPKSVLWLYANHWEGRIKRRQWVCGIGCLEGARAGGQNLPNICPASAHTHFIDKQSGKTNIEINLIKWGKNLLYSSKLIV